MSISDGHGIHAEHMQQVCSWYADDHDIHVKEHVLTHTHTGPGPGRYAQAFCGVHVLRCWYGINFPSFSTHRQGFARPLCVCVRTCPCACTCVVTCTWQSAPAVFFSCFSACAHVHLWLCVCCLLPGHRCRALAWAAAGSAVTLCPCAAGASCVQWALSRPCWGCFMGCESRHPACLCLPKEGRWRRYRTVPGVFSS